MILQTEFAFELPMGFIDSEGNLHKNGKMRLATALDEITVLSDMRVRDNDAYVVIALLSRVVTELGDLRTINTNVIERLFAADLSYLQSFYQQINENGTTRRKYTCPHCGEIFEVDLAAPGGE